MDVSKRGIRNEKPKNVKIGDKFGHLTIVDVFYKIHNGKRTAFANCVCDCGNFIDKSIQILKGCSTGCGCKNYGTNGHKSHGMSKSLIYSRWCGMIKRCHKEKDQGYHRYGARGIKVCEEWKNSFQSFYDWSIENGYSDDLSLDRIDNDGDYCPENCRYATVQQQERNKSTNRRLTIYNETKTVVDWSEDSRCIVTYSLFRQRIMSGMDPELALTSPKDSYSKRKINKYLAFGEEKTIKEWSTDIRCRVEEKTLRRRIESKWGIEKAILTEKYGKNE